MNDDDTPDTTELASKPAISEMGSDTKALIELLRGAEEGETITYGTILDVVGFDVRNRRGPILTAFKRLRADENMHFDCVRNEGYRRLTHAEAARTLPLKSVRRARACARKGLTISSHIDILEVPKDERAAFVGIASICGLMADVGSARSQRKLTELAASDTSASIVSAKKALEALKSD